jgi:transcriptional regulator with XRE-family HTH domain
MPELINQLKELRKSREFTQKEVSEDINISERHYRKYEAGEVAIPSDMLLKLADLYKVSIDFILGRTNIPDMYTNDLKKQINAIDDLSKKIDAVYISAKNAKEIFDMKPPDNN